MTFRTCAIAVGLVCCAAGAQAQTPLTLQINSGRVTLHAQNVPVRTILAEWARVSGAKIVNGDRVGGAPLTLDLEGVSERQALDILLRGVSGYVLAAREQETSGASMYDRIMILPTSVAPRNPAPTTAVLGPAGIVRPIAPRQAEDQDDNDNGDVPQGNDGVPLGRPVPIPRPVGGTTVGAPVMPPVTVAPDNNPPQPQQPAGLVPTPTNPFGLPAGSSTRPGVVTPPPQPLPQGVAPRPQE